MNAGIATNRNQIHSTYPAKLNVKIDSAANQKPKIVVEK
jgi:hypothetical protein